MAEEVQRLTENDWDTLLDNIKSGDCIPFIGPGVQADGFEHRMQIAAELAERFGYPMEDSTDLARVGRFVSVNRSSTYAKRKLMEAYARLPKVTLEDPDDPHVVLASLPVPVYVTTNYDNLMWQALRAAGKDAHQELCKWKSEITDDSSFLARNNTKPTSAQPVVCHLYGYPQVDDRTTNLDSLVFTEDDYYEFLINVSADDDTIPLFVRKAMSKNSILLLGYQIEDVDFRILFHYLLAKPLKVSPGRTHVAVQVVGKTPQEQRKSVQDFLDRYIKSKLLNICIYWGTSQEFAADLKKRWGKGNDKS
jgi:hypothetical protein